MYYFQPLASSRKYEAEYFTATILEWQHLLADDLFKDLIIRSMRYMVDNKKAMIHAFVIMDNHMHLIWHILHPHPRDAVQRDMLKFVAQTIVRELRDNKPEELTKFYVGAQDRKYQIWERNPLSIPLWNEDVLKQKLAYIHNNPVRAGLCNYPEDYKYSSASIYTGREDLFGFITPVYF